MGRTTEAAKTGRGPEAVVDPAFSGTRPSSIATAVARIPRAAGDWAHTTSAGASGSGLERGSGRGAHFFLLWKTLGIAIFARTGGKKGKMWGRDEA